MYWKPCTQKNIKKEEKIVWILWFWGQKAEYTEDITLILYYF